MIGTAPRVRGSNGQLAALLVGMVVCAHRVGEPGPR